MENLTYITGNYGKYISVKEHFEKMGVNIHYLKCDLEEPNVNDITYISIEKARQAYEIVGHPVFVADTGFYIDEYPNHPGYPGAFVKRSGISSDIDSLLATMKNVQNRTCQFVDCLTFYDGIEFYSFYGLSQGTLAYFKRGDSLKKKKSNLWYVFVPKNHTKTLAEMSDLERENRQDGHISATEIFLEWYEGTYLNKMKLKKVLQ